METYLSDVVAGRHCSWNRSKSEKGLQKSNLKKQLEQSRETTRVGALVVAALVVEARSKKGKANGRVNWK